MKLKKDTAGPMSSDRGNKTSDSAYKDAKRGRKEKNERLLKPGYAKVQNIDLSGKNFRIKLVFFILLLFIAITAFIYGIYSWLSVDAGWYEIEVNSSAETTAAQEFYLYYNIGAGDQSAYTEYRQLIVKYTELVDEACMIFSNESYSDYQNLHVLNSHVNEVVMVDESLYDALCLLEKYDSRYLYFAPVYTQYSNLFGSQYDEEALLFDPYENEELAAYYEEIAVYANDPEHINIELLGENQVMLAVSDGYLAFCEENGITEYVDFFLLQNAFEIDYIADGLIAAGYTHGTLSSYDGYTRTLGSGGEDTSQTAQTESETAGSSDADTSGNNGEMSKNVTGTRSDASEDTSGSTLLEWRSNILDFTEQTVCTAATMSYGGALALVVFHDYPLYDYDELHYYSYSDGTVRSPYIDLADGLCKSCIQYFMAFSDNTGCAEMLIRVLPVYAADEFNTDAVEELTADGIDSVWIEDNIISCTSNKVMIADLLEGYEVVYAEVK